MDWWLYSSRTLGGGEEEMKRGGGGGGEGGVLPLCPVVRVSIMSWCESLGTIGFLSQNQQYLMGPGSHLAATLRQSLSPT